MRITSLSKPTRDSAPDACAFGDCADPPTHTVRFHDPDEYVCYCAAHSERAFQYAGAKSRQILR